MEKIEKKTTPCPACGERDSTACDAHEAPDGYVRCRLCRSIYSPALLTQDLTPEEWSAIPRPEDSRCFVSKYLRPFKGSASVALAGRADAEFMRALRRRNLPVEACDLSRTHVDEAAKGSLDAHLGLPSQGALKNRHNLIVVEGLLEYVRDPVAELSAIRNCLERDGRARIEVPSASCRLFRTLGVHYSLFRPPAVRTLYTVESLTRLAARAGFPRVSISFDPARAANWLIRTQQISTTGRLLFRTRDLFVNDPCIHVAVARVL